MTARPTPFILRRATSPAAAEAIRVRTADFDYQLPDEMIAQAPPETRGDSRLLRLAVHSGSQ